MTLNNLIDLLKNYAGSHKQINDFGRGGLEELGASRDQMYPLMWVASYSGRYAGKSMQYSLQIIFSDLIHDDKKNELEVQSDQLLIGLDTVAYLRDNPYFDFQVDEPVTIDFFTERFGDLTAGCMLSFTLRDPKPLDRCVIPKD
jgi:hypothetical protein